MKWTWVLLTLGLCLILSGCSGSSDSSEDLASVISTTTTTTTTTSTTSTSSTTTSTTVPLNAKTVGAGASKGFAINSSGTAKSWGANYEGSNGTYGQLGQGLSTNTNVTTPQSLNDAGTTYLSIVSGEVGACGITSARTVKCWGDNVGDGNGTVVYSPTLINDGTTAYSDIAAGSYHNCGITSAGVLKCWGDGWDGKLGNGDATGTGQSSPVIADSGTTYKRVAAGRNHTCGITTAGAVKCWGTNSSGQLGDTTTTSPRLTPVTVDSGVTYSEIAAGENTTCGITTAGVLKCWGSNGSGQVGDNSNTARSTPTVIDSGVTYSKVSVGGSDGYHTCGITTAGVLKCWGANGSGQLGIGNTTPSLVPVTVDSGVTYTQVASGASMTCALATGGSLKCWGANGSGQLGIGTTTNVVGNRSPVLVGTGY